MNVARTAGFALVAAGLALAAFHARATPLGGAAAVANGVVPFLLATALAGAGVLLARGNLVAEGFARRTLGWAGAGALTFAGCAGWILLGRAAAPAALLPAATLGALVGLSVGVYDARQRARRHQLDELNRINGTLRVATQAVADAETRSQLETRVCEHLQESDAYESAWIGRYDPDAAVITPDAWAGLDDDYYESVEIAVAENEAEGRGLGGRAVRTGEIQYSQDVMADPSMEPWRDLLADHGVESIAVVPIVHHGTVSGILSVYADRAYIFDNPEREMLTELGETVGHAVASIEARDRLRRRERELATQNEHLEQFASVVSHDLRNPLNVAEGYLSMEREENDSERLERVADALDRMDELIEDILTLARTGRTVSEFEPVDLDAVVAEAWESTDTGEATLDTVDTLGTVPGDASRVRELFENLFRNAVEHGSPEGTGEKVDPWSAQEVPVSAPNLTVTVGELDDSTGFYVADDGPGIPEDEREAAFETGYTTSEDGTGFGLNIVRNIADAHGWSVRIADAEGGGARFEFSDREVDAHDDEPAPRPV